MNTSRSTLGFKLTTVENWLEPDPLMAALVNHNHSTGLVRPTQGTDWIAYVARTPLDEHVPFEVWAAFNFAAGAIGYAYFYYPLLTVVSQQALRVADFAVDQLFEAMGKTKVNSLARRLKILRVEGLISEGEFHRWDGIRRLRNKATHPAWQENWGHAMSLQLIETVSLAICSTLVQEFRSRAGECERERGDLIGSRSLDAAAQYAEAWSTKKSSETRKRGKRKT